MPAPSPQPAGVRPARAADLPALLPIWQEMMAEHAACDPAFVLATDAASRWQGWMRELLARPEAFVLVAHPPAAPGPGPAGPPVGFAVGWMADNLPIYQTAEIGFISELAVAARARRRRVGAALLQACRQWFARRGLSECQLATAVWNRPAQAFWRAMGGTPVLVRYRFRGPSAAPGEGGGAAGGGAEAAGGEPVPPWMDG